MASSGPDSAFDLWKEGARKFPINSQREFNIAIRQFKRAMKADKDFARAYGWLAYSYAISVVDHWDLPKPQKGWKAPQVLKEAKNLSDHAVSLDPSDYDNYWARGYVHLHSKMPKEAEADFNWARRINVGNRDLLVESADERVFAGDPDKAIALIKRALKVPDWYRWTLAWSYYFKARTDPLYYNLALEELEKLREEPGQGKSPAEICIILAAIFAQKAQLEKDPKERARLQKLAEGKRKMFERWRKKRTIEQFKRTNPFQRKEDRDHLVKGLKLAKFS